MGREIVDIVLCQLYKHESTTQMKNTEHKQTNKQKAWEFSLQTIAVALGCFPEAEGKFPTTEGIMYFRHKT